MIRPALFTALLTLPFCAGDETISGYADPEATYVLTELGGQAFPARASIAFPKPGRAAGAAPCNSWSAEQTAPYPWLELGPIASTRMACPDLGQESIFFQSLEAMTLAEVQGPILILSNDAGLEMVFRAQD